MSRTGSRGVNETGQVQSAEWKRLPRQLHWATQPLRGETAPGLGAAPALAALGVIWCPRARVYSDGSACGREGGGKSSRRRPPQGDARRPHRCRGACRTRQDVRGSDPYAAAAATTCKPQAIWYSRARVC